MSGSLLFWHAGLLLELDELRQALSEPDRASACIQIAEAWKGRYFGTDLRLAVLWIVTHHSAHELNVELLAYLKLFFGMLTNRRIAHHNPPTGCKHRHVRMILEVFLLHRTIFMTDARAEQHKAVAPSHRAVPRAPEKKKDRSAIKSLPSHAKLASWMLLPVRCLSCNSCVSDKWVEYGRLCALGTQRGRVLNDLGITRMCCRRMFITHVHIVEDLIQYSNKDEKIDDNNTMFLTEVKHERNVSCS